MIPPIPPEGFYTPSNPCETEDIIADVFSNVMGDITQGYQEAITPLAPGSGHQQKVDYQVYYHKKMLLLI